MRKQQARARRGLKTKAVIRHSTRPRLVVYRSGVHIYSQIIVREEKGDRVLVSCSTLDKALRLTLKGNKSEQAYEVGKLLGLRAKEQQIIDVAFDRAGYKYHGRVKALASGAREAGLNF
jgi:large subunit ribosomal protein L18